MWREIGLGGRGAGNQSAALWLASSPPARQHAGAVMCSGMDLFVVMGGTGAGGVKLGDAWGLDLRKDAWVDLIGARVEPSGIEWQKRSGKHAHVIKDALEECAILVLGGVGHRDDGQVQVLTVFRTPQGASTVLQTTVQSVRIIDGGKIDLVAPFMSEFQDGTLLVCNMGQGHTGTCSELGLEANYSQLELLSSVPTPFPKELSSGLVGSRIISLEPEYPNLSAVVGGQTTNADGERVSHGVLGTFDASSQQWDLKITNGPGKRHGHALAFYKGLFFLQGGATTVSEEGAPLELRYHSSTMISSGPLFSVPSICHQNVDSTFTGTSPTFCTRYDNLEISWGPNCRTSHAFAQRLDTLIIFGGSSGPSCSQNGNALLQDTWELNFTEFLEDGNFMTVDESAGDPLFMSSLLVFFVISVIFTFTFVVQLFKVRREAGSSTTSPMTRGLSEKQAHLFPEVHFHETNRDEASCPICLSIFEDTERVMVLPCSHFFHRACITEWLVKCNSCPLCKQRTDQIDAARVGPEDVLTTV